MVIGKRSNPTDRWDFSGPCAFCGKFDSNPAYCPACGSSFCDDHREPEKHNCKAFALDYTKRPTEIKGKKFSNSQMGYMLLFASIFAGACILFYRSYTLGLF